MSVTVPYKAPWDAQLPDHRSQFRLPCGVVAADLVPKSPAYHDEGHSNRLRTCKFRCNNCEGGLRRQHKCLPRNRIQGGDDSVFVT